MSDTSTPSAGHLFVVDGDLTRIVCDALLIPVDQHWNVATPAFADVLGMSSTGQYKGGSLEWPESGMVLAEGDETRSPESGPIRWLGDIGRQGLVSPEHYVRRAKSFVREASQDLKTRKHQEGSSLRTNRPKLAINVIGSGKGGFRTQRGELLDGLIRGLVDVAHDENVDVILVCFGHVMYSAAQSARKDLTEGNEGFNQLQWAGLSSELRTKGLQLAEMARAGKLVVFFGAGVSTGAGLPDWKGLLDSLAKGIVDNGAETLRSLDMRDAMTVIRHYAEKRGMVAELEERLQSLLAGARPGSGESVAPMYGYEHALLASLPTNEYITTNFDSLFEAACEHRQPQLSVIPQNASEIRPGSQWLLKLHGTVGSDLVLSRSDYIGAAATHVALRGIVQALLMTRHMAFIGYGLAEDEFHQLMHEVRNVRAAAPGEHIGTVLVGSGLPHFDAIWPEMEMVQTADASDKDPGEKFRRLWMLIDWIGMNACSDASYIIDETFGYLRGQHEEELATLVEQLRDLRERSGLNSFELDSFLAKFSTHDGRDR